MLSVISLILATALFCCQVDAATVFAHFMIGNTGNYEYADFQNDVRLAQEAHIDGFALNIAYLDEANDWGLEGMFKAAEAAGFKLIFSFDYAGNGPWPKEDVLDLLRWYTTSRAYFYHHGEKPLVSTFEGPDQSDDWIDIKKQLPVFFMPSYSSLGAKKALLKGDVIDGLFSWGAWPEGPNAMTTKVDASYLDFLKQAGGKPYMMPVSPWFYTSDNLWWDRWIHVWYNKPEYVEIISWNDYGESHHIGPVLEKAMVAFGTGKAPFNYALDRPHDAWRMFLPHVIDMYKGGAPAITKEGLNVWYRLNHGRACSTGGTTGNTAAQVQTEGNPSDYAQDRVFFSALVAGNKDLVARVKIGDSDFGNALFDNHPADYNGLWHGSYPVSADKSGAVTVEIVKNGVTVLRLVGRTIDEANCVNGLNNWNAWTGGVWATTAVSAVPVPIAQQGCIAGSGQDDYLSKLCRYTCAFDYCPPGPCYCGLMGKVTASPEVKYAAGYPDPGKTCLYIGLCSYVCERDDTDKCNESCNRDIANKGVCVIPVDPPEPVFTPKPTPTYVQVGDEGYYDYDDARWQNRLICQIFNPPDHQATTNQCYNACRLEIDAAEKEGRTTSYGCVAFTPLDTDFVWYEMSGDLYTPGKCSCDNMLVNEIADIVIEALPAIAQIGCFIVMSTLKLVVEIGLEAIPGVGQAVSAGMKALLYAAKTLGYVYDASQLPADAFDFWLSPCGGSALVPDELKKIFGILEGVADGVSDWKKPKNIPKGSGQKGDSANPDRSPPAASPSPNNGKVTITSVTKSNPKTTKIERVCTASEYSQACYHYYSASVNYPWLGGDLSCTDYNTRLPQSATKHWKDQHIDRTWRAFTDATYEFQGNDRAVNCEADEYPPAYFLPKNPPQDLSKKQGQLIRWIPSNENGGVPQRIWKGFCDENDGGEGNGQLIDGIVGQYNKKLMSFKNKGSSKVSGKTTTEYWEVDYTRAVLTMSYDFKGALTPNKANDWGLRDNPCWPEDIIPEDPGYVLLTSDSWYSTATNSAVINALKVSYADPPDAARLKAAKDNRPDVVVKRDGLQYDLFALDDGGLAMRGANSSRRVTEEEIQGNAQVIDCADRFCSGELADLDGEPVVVIEGAPEPKLPAMPAVNLDAAPTPMAVAPNPRPVRAARPTTMVKMPRAKWS